MVERRKFLFQDATDLLTEITQFWINLIKLEAVLLVLNLDYTEKFLAQF